MYMYTLPMCNYNEHHWCQTLGGTGLVCMVNLYKRMAIGDTIQLPRLCPPLYTLALGKAGEGGLFSI